MGEGKTRGSVKLSDAKVRALKSTETVQRFFDSLVSGFHVRVTPAGAKSYAVTFQRPDGQKVHVTIGSSTVFSAESAREEARRLRELHDQGRDARAHLLSERNAKTISALADLWREGYRDALKPSSQSSYDSILKVIILPALGARLVKDLDYPTVKALHRKESKRHPTGANRMITVLSRLMNIAELEGWRERGTNPCQRFPKSAESPCRRVLTASELAQLELGMASLEAKGKLDSIAADLFRFLALSGLRSGEAQCLAWSDIDLDRNVMTIQDHKTSAKMGPKRLPLNSPVRAILERRAGCKLGKLVFPGLVQDRPIQGLWKMWTRVLQTEECGLNEVTPHDLRRTFMSVSVDLGYPPAIGDTLLGHSLGRITDTYTNLSMEGILSSASEDTALWIMSALQGREPMAGVKDQGPPQRRAQSQVRIHTNLKPSRA